MREVAEACARHGVGMGVYLSPWDRHAPCYGDPEAYDSFYCAQLTELCTGYGPLVEIWFDGAGSAGRSYGWDRIMAVVREHQPDAMVFNMGTPTIRWIGNEDGLATDPVLYAVDADEEGGASRGEQVYLPPECDVSLRRGWFWSGSDEPKSVDHLIAIYYRSIGLGANLLMNVPPDRRGLLADDDVARLREWRMELDRRFGSPVVPTLEDQGNGVWLAHCAGPTAFDHVVLVEDLAAGQRVMRHRVVVDGHEVVAGGTIGQRRIHVCSPQVATTLQIVVEGESPTLSRVELYGTGGAQIPDVPYLASTLEPESHTG